MVLATVVRRVDLTSGGSRLGNCGVVFPQIREPAHLILPLEANKTVSCGLLNFL